MSKGPRQNLPGAAPFRRVGLAFACALLLHSGVMLAHGQTAQAMEVPPEEILPAEQAEKQWKKTARKYVDTSPEASELRSAAMIDDLETVRRLIEEKNVNPNAANRFGKTPLMMAAENGNTETVAYLLRRGADVNARTVAGCTALTCAADNNHPAIIAMLLDRGAFVDARSRAGHTPLLSAARYGNLKSMQMLLDRGADPNARDRQGRTALMRAAEQGHEEIARALLKAGADPSVKNARGEALLDIARRTGNERLLKLLETKLARRQEEKNDAPPQ